MIHSVGWQRSESCFTDDRGVKMLPAMIVLAITAIALFALAGTGQFGSLSGVGTISSFVLGGLDLAVLFFIVCVTCVRMSESKQQITTQTTQEQQNLVKWYCPSEGSRDLLAPFGTAENDLSGAKWDDYNPNPEEKLVIVIPIYTHQAASVIGEENSPTYNVVKKLYPIMQDRLMVLFDLEHVGPEVKERWGPAKEHRKNISEETVWDPIFENKQWISTVEPQWMSKLDQFIASK